MKDDALKLGFGCMHLPLTDPADTTAIDIAALTRMVDMFLERGFTYFDVAYTYHDGHCEPAIRRTLVERYPRESYTLTDKLPTLLVESPEHQERIFAEQLERCGVEYFDRYLVHCATRAFYERAEELGSFEFVRRMKREGKTRMTGFSYHDSPELLDEILTKYPFIDFVQLQISYVDWELTPIQAQRCYQTARRHGKSVVAMCPQKGGMLAEVPHAVERMFRSARPDDTPSMWALRFAASLHGVTTVLSGMSSLADMERNTSFMRDFRPMDDAEREIAAKAAEMIVHAEPIQCTACGYCVPTCPEDIRIPSYLLLYNADNESGHAQFAACLHTYESQAEGHGRASSCIECRNCEAACPQHIRIVDWLKRVTEVFETDTKAALSI